MQNKREIVDNGPDTSEWTQAQRDAYDRNKNATSKRCDHGVSLDETCETCCEALCNLVVPESYPHSPERYAADIARAESYLARNGETVKLSPERIAMIRAHLRGEQDFTAGTIYAGGGVGMGDGQ